MNPAPLLTASGISPADVAAALGGLDLDQVDIRPAPVWLTRLWGKAISAMTLGSKVYVQSALLDRDPSDLGRVVVHELVHVHQWAQLGVMRFLWRYLRGYVKGRFSGLSHEEAYLSIPIEIEAREVANELQGPMGPV